MLFPTHISGFQWTTRGLSHRVNLKRIECFCVWLYFPFNIPTLLVIVSFREIQHNDSFSYFRSFVFACFVFVLSSACSWAASDKKEIISDIVQFARPLEREHEREARGTWDECLCQKEWTEVYLEIESWHNCLLMKKLRDELNSEYPSDSLFV